MTNGEIRNAESQSWTAGIQFGDLIRHNDNLRFSAREESRISDGELILQYSFGKQIRIPIKQKPQTIYTAGYSQKTENSKWSAAAEWKLGNKCKRSFFRRRIANSVSWIKMKRVILILIFAGFLTACGGGGGAAPSVNSDDSPPPEETRRLTPAEQAEVRTAADALLNDLDSLENNTEADSLRQEIDALIADINAARHTIEELQNEIANLRSEIDTLKVAETQTEPPPPPPNCGANEIADGQNCVCISGYVRQNGVCELPPPNCGANEIADGQNCVCISGYVQQNGACELPPPNCGANEEIIGGSCECISGYVRQNGVCELPPPNWRCE